MIDWSTCPAVERDPQRVSGAWVFCGTRVPVARIVGGLAGGMSYEEVVKSYQVTIEDIRAALEFAQDLIEQQAFYPLPKAG